MKDKTLTYIAETAGVTVQFISQLVNTDKTKKRPNYKRAKQIGRITGTNPIVWLEGSTSEIKADLKARGFAA